MNLKKLGMTEDIIQESRKYENRYIGRVSSQSKNLYKVFTEKGEITAEIAGKFHYRVKDAADYPAVGDFVMVDRTDDFSGHAIIHHVLPRKSVFARKVAGTREEVQIVAANIDTVFICMALNHDFNLRRLERYLSIAWDSGAIPVIVLTKSEEDIETKLDEVSTVALGVDVHVTKASDESYQL